MTEDFLHQIMPTLIVMVVLLIVILLTTTYVVGNFNRRIVELTRAHEQERKTIFEKATGDLFENICELDITHNRPANQKTEEYFVHLGAPSDTPYDQGLKMIAEKQIKPEFRKGYLATFSPDHILHVFQEGVDCLKYEFMITDDGQNYYWMRIIAKLVLAEADGSLHMLTYRQNIDAEKKQEQRMQELARTDGMTGLLNKVSTQRAMDEMLFRNQDKKYAFFIFDIDHFKDTNDFYGHVFGDSVIKKICFDPSGGLWKEYSDRTNWRRRICCYHGNQRGGHGRKTEPGS